MKKIYNELKKYQYLNSEITADSMKTFFLLEELSEIADKKPVEETLRLFFEEEFINAANELCYNKLHLALFPFISKYAQKWEFGYWEAEDQKKKAMVAPALKALSSIILKK